MSGFVHSFSLIVTVFRQTLHSFFVMMIYFYHTASAPDRYRHAPGILQDHAVVVYSLHIIEVHNIGLMASVKSIA